MTFQRVFEAFEGATAGQPMRAVVCVPEETIAARGGLPCLVPRVDPDADICYCEAKHVQSFYAGIARERTRDFAEYDGYVLILDEVDALVIDEEPNEAFVYRNEDLSR